MADALDETEERRIRHISGYPDFGYPPEWIPMGLGGDRALYRRPRVVPVYNPIVHAQYGDQNQGGFDPFDTSMMGQQMSTSGCQDIEQTEESRSEDCDWHAATREQEQRYARLRQSEQQLEPEQGHVQMAETEKSLGTRVIRNSPAQQSREIGEATGPRRYGISPQPSSSSDDGETSSPKFNSAQPPPHVKSLSGTTLHDVLTGEKGSGCQIVRHIHACSIRYSEKPDGHFEHFHHNDDDDPGPTKPHPHYEQIAVNGEIVVRHDTGVESTPMDNHTGPIPYRTASITAAHDEDDIALIHADPVTSRTVSVVVSHEDGIPPENRTNITLSRFRRAQIMQTGRALENVHARRNERDVEGREALESAGLNTSNTPSNSTSSGNAGQRNEGDEPSSVGIQHNHPNSPTEEEIARLHNTPVQWPQPAHHANETDQSRRAHSGDSMEADRQAEIDRDLDTVYDKYAQFQADEFVRQYPHLAEQGRQQEQGHAPDMRGGYGLDRASEEEEETSVEEAQWLDRQQLLAAQQQEHSPRERAAEAERAFWQRHREGLDADTTRWNERRAAGRVRCAAYPMDLDREFVYQRHFESADEAVVNEEELRPVSYRHQPRRRLFGAEDAPVRQSAHHCELRQRPNFLALEEDVLQAETLEQCESIGNSLAELQLALNRRHADLTEARRLRQNARSAARAARANVHRDLQRLAIASTSLQFSAVATRTLMQNARNAARVCRNFDVDDEERYSFTAQYPMNYDGVSQFGDGEDEGNEDERDVMDDLASHRSGSAPPHIRGGAADEDDAERLSKKCSAPAYVGLSSDDNSVTATTTVASSSCNKSLSPPRIRGGVSDPYKFIGRPAIGYADPRDLGIVYVPTDPGPPTHHALACCYTCTPLRSSGGGESREFGARIGVSGRTA
ncbi:hypothetical protein BU25DRAFT_492059 [Macroventuria anomochaeta]|uniref:Uncharacterized protein n=1 Tax=Macroventuria anomochaeta TaxID=301207 RepID=A0ACB6RXG7_9PLEO|nr:uncharacterized protein BU25DRAFT_492059 [Macroventuria anomochaeta]KAF2626736.1 hypothetical protein BU25DRAFT_492059 [Macroventuria anomochaeta]